MNHRARRFVLVALLEVSAGALVVTGVAVFDPSSAHSLAAAYSMGAIALLGWLAYFGWPD